MLALITGASQGIGEAAAINLAEAGHDLLLVSRSKAKLNAVKEKVAATGRVAQAYPCDVSDPDAFEAILSQILKAHGAPEILVNNAGYGGPFVALDQLPRADWEQIHRVNLDAASAACRVILPEMARSGFGRVINISSIFGFISGSGSVAYSSTKHALVGLTRGIAAEWGPFGITCNCVCPGYTDTPMLDELKAHDPEKLEGLKEQTPVKRLGTPAEVARVVGFLAAANAGFINGSQVVVDGGLTCHLGY